MDEQAVETEASAAGRSPRADSVRNRARVLEAAEEVFGSLGLAAPIDRIAERAGVGVGTIYRHFPTKETLFQAIVLDHLERLVGRARQLAGAEDACEALFGFLREIVEESEHKRDLVDALVGAGIDVFSTAEALKADLAGAIEILLRRAQAEEQVRSDVSVDDLECLVTGICMTSGREGSPPSPGKMLEIVCKGLRT
jgi:AcrR family transcriptional regulator